MEPSPESTLLKPNIPQELIFEFLLRLPIKSLLRFKCVSKPWNSLISSSEFIKARIKISSGDKKFSDHRILLPPQRSSGTLYTSSLQEFGYGDLVVNPLALEFPLQPLNHRVSFAGSLNGLLCLCLDFASNLILWNPSIEKFKELPISAIEYDTFGFGYDESTDDYKIVGFSYKREASKTEVSIYSLKTNTLCKIHDYSDGRVFGLGLGTFVSGSLHWKAGWHDSPMYVDYIASFDIAAGTFGMISLPKFDGFPHSLWSLDILGGCLSICYSDFITEMHVYIMKDNVEKKWTKLMSISYNDEIQSLRRNFVSAVFLFENGGILLSFGSNLVLYKDGEFYIKNRGAGNKCNPCCFGNSYCTYFESLVSPNISTEIAFTTDE